MATTGPAWTGYLVKRQETESKPSGHLWQHRKAPGGSHRSKGLEKVPLGCGTRWSVRSLLTQTIPRHWEFELEVRLGHFHLEKNASNVLMAPGCSGRAGPAPRKGRTNTGCRQQSWQGAFSEGKSSPENPHFTQSNGLQAEHPHPAQAHRAESTWTSHLKDSHLQDHFSPKVFLPLTLHHLYQLLTLTAWLDSLTEQKKPPSQAEEFAR